MLAILLGYKPLFDFRYWLHPRPVPLGPSLVGNILVFFGWFLIVAVVLRLVSRAIKKRDGLKAAVLRRLSTLLGQTGALGLLFLFFTYEQLPVLGMRGWFLLLFLYFLIRLAFIVVWFVRDYPREKARRTEHQRLARYLPNTAGR